MTHGDTPQILVINPGGSSTKIALFEGDREKFTENIRHSPEDLEGFEDAFSQLDWRLGILRSMIKDKSVDISALGAVVGRGGAIVPVPSGTFVVDDTMLKEIREGRVMVQHASLLGAPMANAIALEAGCKAFVVDPVCVDEMLEEAKVTGLPAITRKPLAHTLNVKAASRHAAAKLGRSLDEINLIVLHLGSGFTIAAQRKGRQIDHNDPTATGPMAPTRTGSLPVLEYTDLCFSGERTLHELKKLLVTSGGWTAHLGTDDVREIYRRVDDGDDTARLVLDATIHQIVKEVGGLFAVFKGQVDAVVLTGGVARSERFLGELVRRLDWIGKPFVEVPGEDEMGALAAGALRAIRGEDTPMTIADFL